MYEKSKAQSKESSLTRGSNNKYAFGEKGQSNISKVSQISQKST